MSNQSLNFWHYPLYQTHNPCLETQSNASSHNVANQNDRLQKQTSMHFSGLQEIQWAKNCNDYDFQQDNMCNNATKFAFDESEDDSQHDQQENDADYKTKELEQPKAANKVHKAQSVIKPKKRDSYRLDDDDQYEKQKQLTDQIDQNMHGSHADSNFRSQKGYTRKSITKQFIVEAKKYFQLYNQEEEAGKIHKRTSLRRFAENTGYGYSTIYSLYKKWVEDPILLKFQEQFRNSRSGKHGKIRGKNRITTYRNELLCKIIEQNPLLSTKEIAEKIRQNENGNQRTKNGKVVEINQKSIMRLINNQDLKKVRFKLISSRRNHSEDIERRYKYCKQMIECQEKGEKIFFLDEMAVNLWVTRDRAWGRQGQAFSNVMINLKKDSFLVVAVMDEQCQIQYQVIMGNCIRLKYAKVIANLLENICSRYANDKRVLVIHSAVGPSRDIMRQIALKRDFKVLLLPPFTSQLNPLQSWFSQIRNELKRQKFKNDSELLLALKKSLQTLKQKSLPNYHQSVQKYLEKGLTRQAF